MSKAPTKGNWEGRDLTDNWWPETKVVCKAYDDVYDFYSVLTRQKEDMNAMSA